MPEQNQYFSERKKSFVYAFKGISNAFKHGPNFKIQLIIAVLVIIAGLLLQIDVVEWGLVLLCIGGVLGAEIMNTSIEHLADVVHPGHDQLVGKVKDMGAAAVLVIALCSALTGLLIFLPKIISVLWY